MSKRKVKAAVARKKKAPETVVEPVKTAEPSKKSNGGMYILAAVLVFVAAEIYFMTMKNIRESKRPVYVNSWDHQYKGCTSIGQYGDYIYAVDNTRGDVYKTDKTNGTLEKIMSFPEGVYSAVQNSTGDIYVLTKTNEVIQVDGKTYKTVKTNKITDINDVNWMDVDSKDNFYLISSSSGLVEKYSPDFTKILSFGGHGDDKANLNGAGKIFAGPKDDIYVLNSYKPGAMEVKIFNDGGKYLRSWPVTKIKKFDSLTNMAIAADGNVYINSYEESKIYVFSGNGKYLGSFDGDKDKHFQIIYAASVTGGKDGFIYVHTHKLVVFKTLTY
jgi:hypothetical protein